VQAGPGCAEIADAQLFMQLKARVEAASPSDTRLIVAKFRRFDKLHPPNGVCIRPNSTRSVVRSKILPDGARSSPGCGRSPTVITDAKERFGPLYLPKPCKAFQS
jgi:hypothetical protein